LAQEKTNPKNWYHNTEMLSWRPGYPLPTLSGLDSQNSLCMTRPASPAVPAAALWPYSVPANFHCETRPVATFDGPD
jgi:hypothetical protein